MILTNFTIQSYGESAILLSWPSVIDPVNFRAINQVKLFLQQVFKTGIIDLVPSYASLTIYFDSQLLEQDKLISAIRQVDIKKKTAMPSSTVWKIPACFHPDFALDIDELSTKTQLSKKAFITRFTQPRYLLYMMGFLPGFPYLGGLPEQLHFPRKKSPRSLVHAGSIAIGGQQAGIYPSDSPGGWNIIGRTPILLFDPANQPPTHFLPGDFIQFYSISKATFTKISSEVSAGDYQLKPRSNG